MTTRQTARRWTTAAATAALALVCLAAPLAAAPLPRDVRVTDVTGTSFSVVWTDGEPVTGTVEVFEDVLAATPVAGATVETSLVLGGDPGVATAAEDLGVLRARISGLEPGRAYFFRTVTTPKGGGGPFTVPATGPLFSVVTETRAFPRAANLLGADVTDGDGTTPRPGTLLLITLPGAARPLSAVAGDGYPGALGVVDLANLYDGAGTSLPTTGGESVTVEALGGTAGRTSTTDTLAANAGLGTLQRVATPLVLQPVVDTDLDGMPDDYETANGLNPAVNDAAGNLDTDGLTNLEEYERGTDPQSADSDGDGLTDGDEVNLHGTSPTEPDTDRDGRTDDDELNGVPTSDPLDADTDDDGVDDGTEVANGTDPNDDQDFPLLDFDLDGVGDLVDNCPVIPNPTQTDTDGDTLGDACDGDDDADGIGDGPDNCPRVANVGQDDDDLDNVGNLCDNCPADSNPIQEDNEGDGIGDLCDPDDDNDGVNDYQDAPPPSDTPVDILSITAVVDTTFPVSGNDAAIIGLGKFFRDEDPTRYVNLGNFDLKTRQFTADTVAPADQTKPGWYSVVIDYGACDCFQIQERDSITVTSDVGNLTAYFPADAQDLPSNLFFVSDDGSTYQAYFLPDGPLATLVFSSTVGGPLDNCPFTPNPGQEDVDGDGLGDLCDISADDLDGDGVLNVADNCPNTHNTDQANNDGDGLGDACDPDDDNDAVDDADEATLLTDPLNADTDGDGVLDGAEDFDFDGRDNSTELGLGRSPFDPDLELRAGFNLVAYPVEVPGGLTAFGLLTALGTDSEVVGIQRLDAAGQTFEEARYTGGVPTGVDFPIISSAGYVVEMLVDKLVTISGTATCATHDLQSGVNLIGFPCFPSGFRTDDMLDHLGNDIELSATQAFDPVTGRFETAVFESGLPAGADEPVAAGRGYLVYSGLEKLGIAPPITPPTVAITSPADMADVGQASILVSGTIAPADAVVTVNGVVATLDGLGGWDATIGLVSGANVITAVARSVENLSASDSITVNRIAVDYSIARNGSVSDTRIASDPNASNVATYSWNLTNLPTDVTYTNDGATFISATELEIAFTIDVGPTAALGFHTFEANYTFRDGSNNIVFTEQFVFTLEILP